MPRTISSRLVAAGCFAAVAVATLLAVLAHAARGPEVALDAPREVRAGDTLRVAVRGDLHRDGTLSVTVSAPGRPCTARGARVVIPSLPAPGTFRATGETAVGAPGRHELCALARIRDLEPRVVARRVVAVRPPA